MSSVYGQTLLDDMVQRQGLPIPLVKQAAQEILTVIREGLISDGVVNVSNFGTFRLKLAAARQGFNPQTRERITIPAHQRVIFSPCKALRDLIQPVHQPVIPIEADETNEAAQRAAARSAPIAVAAPIAVKTIVPAAVPLTAQPEPVETPPPSATEPGAERRITTDRRHHADKLKTESSEVTDVAGRLDTYTDSVDAINLHVEDESSTESRPRKGLYLGAAAIIVIAAVSTSLLYNSTPQETAPATIITPPTSALTTATPPAEAPQEVTAPLPEETAPPAAEETDYSTLYTEMAEAQPDSPAAVPEAAAETVTEQPAPTIAEPVATATSKAASFFFTEKPHKITNGESLWRLARQHYKNPLLWPHIYQANAALIDNPDNLRQGRTITLPSLQGTADNLTKTDRRNIAEGYYLTYLYYKNTGNKDAFFALLEAKRYDNKVVEEHRSLLQLSKVEEILLGHQETMPF